MRRLVRGLASNRESARQGFFLCLVEVVRQGQGQEDMVQKVMELAKEELGHKGATKAVS